MSDESGSAAPENGQEPAEKSGASTSTAAEEWGADDWKAFAAEVGLTPDKVKERLGHARTWEERAKANSKSATEAEKLQKQIAEMQQALSERDSRDRERSGRMAMTQLRSSLTESGIKADDAADLLSEIEPARLLDKKGEPDEAAIKRICEALRKLGGRPTVDPDQGKASAGAGGDMASFMRGLRAGR